MRKKIVKSDKEWRAHLTPEQYRITREKGTEPAGTGKYLHEKRKGIYKCICCGQPLFSSETKYDSGSGWPSFWEPVDEENIEIRSDVSHGMERTEVLCSQCEAHLGHVFENGPEPTGLRYCIDSAVLDLAPEEEQG
jgi:peptide-methionine (R)-S-oxide reductase